MRNFLIICAKNAVNAALVTLGPVYADPASYNLTTHAGLLHVAELVGWAVIVREGTIWVPILLKWSTTNSTPGGN